MLTLLKVELCLRPEDTNKNFYFSFGVGNAAKKLWIDFSYDPKNLADDEKANEILEEGFRKYILPENRDEYEAMRSRFIPLVNLITISVDSPSGYVGAAHRHSHEQHNYISFEDSTPGFCRCKIEPGQWKVCVSTHAVVTHECHVTLIVTEEK